MTREKRYPVSLAAIFLSFWRHRELVWQMTRQEVLARYQGSFMGLLWSFLNPILMLGIYTFVFGFVFPSRWEYQADSPPEFAIILFAGLIAVNLFSECVNRACPLIVSHPSYVKKVVFPLEVLPWITVGSALFHTSVNFLVLLLLYVGTYHRIEPTVLLLPVLYLPFIFLIIGLCWLLSCLGVFLRDIGQTVSLLTSALMFLSPVFYSLSFVPEAARPYFYFNPMTFMILQTRGLLLGENGLDWRGWAVYTAVGLFVAWTGFALFQKLRKNFADVL